MVAVDHGTPRVWGRRPLPPSPWRLWELVLSHCLQPGLAISKVPCHCLVGWGAGGVWNSSWHNLSSLSLPFSPSMLWLVTRTTQDGKRVSLSHIRYAQLRGMMCIPRSQLCPALCPPPPPTPPLLQPPYWVFKPMKHAPPRSLFCRTRVYDLINPQWPQTHTARSKDSFLPGKKQLEVLWDPSGYLISLLCKKRLWCPPCRMPGSAPSTGWQEIPKRCPWSWRGRDNSRTKHHSGLRLSSLNPSSVTHHCMTWGDLPNLSVPQFPHL